MPNKEKALKDALEASINVLKETFGDEYDRATVEDNIPLLLQAMGPLLDDYLQLETVQTFEETFKKRFPNHVLVSYGGSVLDYIIGNVQTAVADEIILMMETWDRTLSEAQSLPKFSSSVEKRDWDVARAHTKELISEVRQYRTRGRGGHHSTHTGSVPRLDT